MNQNTKSRLRNPAAKALPKSREDAGRSTASGRQASACLGLAASPG